MKILELKVLRGPNYWSNYRKNLIVMKLDIGIYEKLPTNKINDFAKNLVATLPSLAVHRCSVGKEGGFMSKVKQGTSLSHVVEHVALELQYLASMDCGFGRTRLADKQGIYTVVFSYLIENAGLYAAKAAVRLVEAIVAGKDYPLDLAIEHLKSIFYREAPGPSTQSLITTAETRNIPVYRLDKQSLVMLGQGKNQKIISATIASTTSSIAVDIAGNKSLTKKILADNYIPVPQGLVIKNQEELDEAIKNPGYPFVVKPLNGNHGRGITTNVNSRKQAIDAFINAKTISDQVIIEKHIYGNDYRILVINYELAAVSKRIPAIVTGDGSSTIQELIDQLNQHPDRGEGHEKILTKIKIDKNTQSILKEHGLTLNSILKKDKELRIKDTANISSGGTAYDVTGLIHPQNILLAERAARLIGLDICGIDMIAEDIGIPVNRDNGAILEINAAPGLRMHLHPFNGKGRNVAAPIIDMLFPDAHQSRIPLVAVTGTNGKTTTTRFIAHFAKCSGYIPGFTSTDGIYIDGNLITEGDCGGPISAGVVLRDSSVDFAVLECARGGILRSGLGFDYCNISVVTNIAADHLGLSGINTLKELSAVKSVVPKSTFNDGFAVLNADDELVRVMQKDLSCHIALFSIDPENEHIVAHCEAGGLAAIIEDETFVLCRGKIKIPLLPVKEVPLTLNGNLKCMIKNSLAAILAAVALDMPIEKIRYGMKSFMLSPEMTPGRMNRFEFSKFTLILDYVHNPDGYMELKDYLHHEQSSCKIGIIAAVGDRRDEDIVLLGQYAAEIFDELIIRHDKDGRGRNNWEISELLINGILKSGQDKKIIIISDEAEAIRYACNYCPEGALIFVSSDNIKNSLSLIKELKMNDNKNQINYEA